MKDLGEFIFENYYKRIGFTKEDNYYSLKKQRKDLVFLAINITKKNTRNLPKIKNSMKKAKLKKFKRYKELFKKETTMT